MYYYSLPTSAVQSITATTYACGVESKVIAAVGALLKCPSAVEGYGPTLIVQQTVILALGFSMLQCVPSLSCTRLNVLTLAVM